MSGIDIHIKDCEAILGKGYKEVHKWLDAYAKKWNPHIHLEYHRQFRHHSDAVVYIREKWGHYASQAAKIHIIRDNDYICYPIEAMTEDMIEERYQKALKYCYPITNEDWKKELK